MEYDTDMDENMSSSHLPMSPWLRSAFKTQPFATEVMELQWKNSQTKCAPLDALMAEARVSRTPPSSDFDLPVFTEPALPLSSASTSIASHATGSKPRPPPSREGNLERTPSGSLSSLFGGPSVFLGTLKTITHRVDENTRTRQEQMARKRLKEKKDLAKSGGIQRRRKSGRVVGTAVSTGDISVRRSPVEAEAIFSRQCSLPELAQPPDVSDTDISMGIEANTTSRTDMDPSALVQHRASLDSSKSPAIVDSNPSNRPIQRQSQTPPASPSGSSSRYRPPSTFTANPSPISSRDTTPVPPCWPPVISRTDRPPKESPLGPAMKPPTTRTTSVLSVPRDSIRPSRTNPTPPMSACPLLSQTLQHLPRPSQRPPVLGMHRPHSTKLFAAGPNLSQSNHKIPAFKPPQMRSRGATAAKTEPARQVPTPEPSPQQTGTHAARASPPLPGIVDADSSYGDISFDMDELEMALQKYD